MRKDDVSAAEACRRLKTKFRAHPTVASRQPATLTRLYFEERARANRTLREKIAAGGEGGNALRRRMLAALIG